MDSQSKDDKYSTKTTKSSIVILSNKKYLSFVVSQFKSFNQILWVEDFVSLIDKISKIPVAVVISDYELFDQKIMHKYPQIKFILVSNKEIKQDANNSIKILHKPICINNLLSEILLSIKNTNTSGATIGTLCFNFYGRKIETEEGKIISLTEKEALLINYLYENKNFIKREEILKSIWGYSDMIETHTLETHIYRLRKKISEDFIINSEQGYMIKS